MYSDRAFLGPDEQLVFVEGDEGKDLEFNIIFSKTNIPAGPVSRLTDSQNDYKIVGVVKDGYFLKTIYIPEIPTIINEDYKDAIFGHRPGFRKRIENPRTILTRDGKVFSNMRYHGKRFDQYRYHIISRQLPRIFKAFEKIESEITGHRLKPKVKYSLPY